MSLLLFHSPSLWIALFRWNTPNSLWIGLIIHQYDSLTLELIWKSLQCVYCWISFPLFFFSSVLTEYIQQISSSLLYISSRCSHFSKLKKKHHLKKKRHFFFFFCFENLLFSSIHQITHNSHSICVIYPSNYSSLFRYSFPDFHINFSCCFCISEKSKDR